MKRCPDNQINAPFIDISRLNGLFFFYCDRLSSAQLHVHVVPLQAPKHRPIIGPHPVEPTLRSKQVSRPKLHLAFRNLLNKPPPKKKKKTHQTNKTFRKNLPSILLFRLSFLLHCL